MLAAYAAMAFGVGTLCGCVIGRGLPALIIALVAGGLLIGAILAAGNGIAKSDRAVLDQTDYGALVADYMVQDVHDGRLLTYEEASAILPQTDPAFAARFVAVRTGVPGDMSRAVIGMQVATGFGLTIVLLAAAGYVVTRRRIA